MTTYYNIYSNIVFVGSQVADYVQAFRPAGFPFAD
jgi:hypothetical protein